MKRLILIAALVLIPWQALAVELDVDNNTYTDADKGGTNAATEQDPTVDTSAEIQAIIGAGVYQGSDADLDYLAGQTLSANVRSLLESANYAAMTGLPYLNSVSQAVSLGDAGALTPPAGYSKVSVALTCTADPSAIVMTEGGSETNESTVIITNVGSNTCTFADAAGVVELPGTITLEQYETMTLQYKTDRWVLNSFATNAISISSINIQSGTINGAIRPINQTADTYTLGTNSTADSWGTYFTNTDAAADGAAYTMESAVAGMHFCLENGQGVTEALSVTPAAGDYLVKNGVRGTAATARASSGAAGDKICIFCQDATDCKITAEVGTWAE